MSIPWFPRDITIPYSHIASISFDYQGTKYENPEDPQEFTIFCSDRSLIGDNCVLKHTRNGFQDSSYFTQFVPLLADVWSDYQGAIKSVCFSNQTLKKRDNILRHFQEKLINSPLNKEYKNGMSTTEHQVIHLFLNQYLPSIKGLCPRCFNLFLPLKGFGSRWRSKADKDSKVIFQEIRLSVPKMNSTYDSHKVLYVTHEFKPLDDMLHVTFEGIHYTTQTDWKGEIIESQLCHDQLHTQEFGLLSERISQIERFPSRHIPYDVYNSKYLKLIEQFPEISKQEFKICQCPK